MLPQNFTRKNPLNRLRTYWVDQAKWWCSRSLEWWAAHLTALYVGGAITIMGARFDELRVLKLNEIGDLAAGVFGPVAFLWLVLGYVQQGRELKLSSDALRMQASELKASVEAQNAMLENHERSLDPLLIVSHNKKIKADNSLPMFEVVNYGEYCSDVRGTVRGAGEYNHGIALSPLINGISRWFSCGDLKEDGQYVLEIEYEKINRKLGRQSFLIYKGTEDGGVIRINIQAYNTIARFMKIPSEKYRL